METKKTNTLEIKDQDHQIFFCDGFSVPSEVFFFFFYVPPPWGVGGHIVFSADPVGVGVGVASCPLSISLLNGHILAKLTQIYHSEGEKC